MRVYWLMICRVVCLVKGLSYAFPFSHLACILLGASSVMYIRQCGIFFRYLPLFKSFAKYTVPSVTYIRRSGVLILNHFWFSDLHPFKGFCQVYGFVNNVHPSMWNLVTQPFFFFSLTYTHLRDFAKCMASSVTYIRQGGILLLNYFLCILLES